MNTTLRNSAPLRLILAGVLVGVVGTAAVMSLTRRTTDGTARSGSTAPHKEDEHTPDEHSLIKLSPDAIQTAGIRVEPVRLAPIGENLTVPGEVEVTPNRGAKITPPAPGKVVRILANLGDTVRAGQPLLVLDSYEVAQAHAAERQAQSGVKQAQATLQTAHAEIDQAQASLRLAEAEVEQARTKLRSAETALQRQRELAQAGSFSQPSLQAAQAEVAGAQSELLQAQTDLQSHLVVLQRAERLFREELISRSELEQAQLENQQDKARVQRAQTRLDIAKQTLEREQRVARGDLLSKQVVQTAEADVRAAQGDVQKAVQGLARARQDVRRAQKGEQAARTALQGAEDAVRAVRVNLYALEGTGHAEGEGGLLTLRAPISGVITERHATIGEAVERATALFVVENLETVLIVAGVPEKEVARVRTGQPVEVTVSAYPRQRFSGVVQTVASRLDPKTRALAVRCLVENRAGLLKPEMFARVSLGIGARTNALTVPLSALIEEGGERFVYVEEEGGFEKRMVRIGRMSGGQAEVLSGLQAGDRVVVEGVFVLKSEAVKESLKGHEH